MLSDNKSIAVSGSRGKLTPMKICGNSEPFTSSHSVEVLSANIPSGIPRYHGLVHIFCEQSVKLALKDYKTCFRQWLKKEKKQTEL